MKNIELVVNEMIEWMREKVNSAGAKGIVYGLSGGIDSAVVAAVAERAFPGENLGIMMPCYSNPIDEEHAILVADALKLVTKKVVLDEAFDTMKKIVASDGNEPKLVLANVKSRLRMVTLYYHAALKNYLVSGTGNKSELTIGYFTKYGDGGSDMLPLASFVKSEVRELASYLGIPEIVITKPPTAGLWENQTDEGEMGMTYNQLDEYILTGKAEDQIKEKIEKMNKFSEHKRNIAPMFMPSEKS